MTLIPQTSMFGAFWAIPFLNETIWGDRRSSASFAPPPELKPMNKCIPGTPQKSPPFSTPHPLNPHHLASPESWLRAKNIMNIWKPIEKFPCSRFGSNFQNLCWSFSCFTKSDGLVLVSGNHLFGPWDCFKVQSFAKNIILNKAQIRKTKTSFQPRKRGDLKNMIPDGGDFDSQQVWPGKIYQINNIFTTYGK